MDVQTPSPTQPMRWATFWIYFSLPFGAISCLYTAYSFFSGGNPLPAWICVLFAALQVTVAVLLVEGSRWGWRGNWLVVAANFLASVAVAFLQTRGGIEEQIIRSCLMAAGIALIWLWPNWVYWGRRADQFDGAAVNKFRGQWYWAPSIAWVVVVVFLGFAGAGLQYARQAMSVSTQPTSPVVAPTFEVMRNREWAAFYNDPHFTYLLDSAQRRSLFSSFLAQSIAEQPASTYRTHLEDAAQRLIAYNTKRGEETWDADLAALSARACVVLSGTNRSYFQLYVNEAARPGITNDQLFSIAMKRLMDSPEFDAKAVCQGP